VYGQIIRGVITIEQGCVQFVVQSSGPIQVARAGVIQLQINCTRRLNTLWLNAEEDQPLVQLYFDMPR